MLKTLSKLLSVVVFAALLLEGLSRLVFPMPEVLNFNRVNYSRGFTTSKGGDSSTLANASFIWFSELDNVETKHELNLYGFRDRNWDRKVETGVTRVAFVGASMVEGFMANSGETLTDGFLKAAPPDIEALNFGIGATGIPVYFRLSRDLVPVFHPQHLIVVFSENVVRPVRYDPGWLANPLIPEESNPWLPRILQVIQYRRRHAQVIWRWRSRPFQFMPAVPHPLNPWSNETRAAYFQKFIAPPIAQAMRAGKFNPFMADQLKTLEKTIARPARLLPALRALTQYLAAQSVRLGIVYIPNQVQVSDHYLEYQRALSTSTVDSFLGKNYQLHAREFSRICKTLGIPFLDLTPSLRRVENAGQRLYWGYDSHLNAEGYMLAGRTIYAWWADSL